MKVADLKVLLGDLGLQLLLPGLGLVEFLAGSQGAAMDGNNEAKGDGMDGLIDIRVCSEEYLGCLR